MDEMMSQVMDKLVVSFVEGKISADELKARYAELRAASSGVEAEFAEARGEAPVPQAASQPATEPVDHVTAQARRARSLMDQLQNKIDASRAQPAGPLDNSAERVNYIAYLAKRV